MLAATRPLRAAYRLLRRGGILLPAVAVLHACTEGRSPLDPPRDGAFSLALRPHYSVQGAGGGAGLATLPINRIRLTARDSATGTLLGQRVLDDVDSSAQQWSVAIDVKVPEGMTQVVVLVRIELVHVVGNVEDVQWSGVTAGIRVTPGSTQAPSTAEVTLHPGPPDNLLVTAVRVSGAGPLMEGDSLKLSAAVETSGSAQPKVFWHTLDPAIASVDGAGLVRALRGGTARIVAVSGPRADTATLRVRQRPASIRLTPAEISLASLGAEAQFAAVVLDPRGDAIDGESVVWRGGESGVAEHLGGGRVRARANGSYSLTAMVVSDTTVRALGSVLVQQAAASVDVQPATLRFVGTGASAQLTGTARDANGNIVAGAAFSWSSSNPGVATVDGNGLVRVVGVGQASITARSGAASGSTHVNVEQRPTEVRISPASATLDAVGATASFAATVHAQDGTVLQLPVTWSSSDPAVASVDAAGNVTAAGDGAATITARHADLAASAGVTVRQVARTIEVEPTSLQIGIGATATLHATVRDSRGNTMTAPVTWSSANSGIATVSPDGVVRGVTSGTAIITAARDGISATASVTVMAPNLVATRLLLSPATVFENGSVTATLSVSNEGDAAAPGTTATISLGTLASRSVGIPALAAGASATVSTSFSILPEIAWPDQITATAVVNPDQTVEESSHGDNTVSSGAVEVRMAVARVVTTPASVSFTALGATTQLTSVTTDRHNRAIPRGVEYQSADTTVARVSASGLVTAAGAGTTNIRISAGSVSIQVPVTVTLVPASVKVTPGVATFATLGRTLALSVEVRDSRANVFNAPVIWMSTAPAVAQVDGAGVVQAVAEGVAKIIATAGSISDTAEITVLQRPANLIVAGGAATVSLGQNVQLSVTDSAGSAIPAGSISWSVTPAARGTISSSGVFTPLQTGSVTLEGGRGGVSVSRTIEIAASNLTIAALTIPDSVTAGQPTSASITIENNGSTAAPASTLRLKLTGGGHSSTVDAALPPLIAGQSVSVPVSFVVSSAVPWPATVTAEFRVDADNAVAESNESDNVATRQVSVRFPVHDIHIDPVAPLTYLDATTTVNAQPKDVHGRSLTGRPVTFISEHPHIASLTSGNLVSAVAPGNATLTASSEGVSRSVVVTVVQVPHSLQLSAASLHFGTVSVSTAVTATAKDAGGRDIPNPTISWASANTGVATVSGVGVVTALSNGTSLITATAGAVTATVQVEVDQQLGSVQVQGGATAVVTGGSLQLIANDTAGRPIPAGGVTWSVSPSGRGSINAAGTFTAAGAGGATLQASRGAVTRTVTVTVQAPDLFVAQLTLPDSIVDDVSVTASILIGNGGNAAAPPAAGQLRLVSGGTVLAQFGFVTPAVSSGGTQLATATVKVDAQAHWPAVLGVEVVLDPDNQVVESNKSNNSASGSVRLILPVTQIEAPSETIYLHVNQTTPVAAILKNKFGQLVEGGHPQYTSSNESVAVVSASGVITAKSVGLADITITAASGVSRIVRVEVQVSD